MKKLLKKPPFHLISLKPQKNVKKQGDIHDRPRKGL
jgi:hypothetical protein